MRTAALLEVEQSIVAGLGCQPRRFETSMNMLNANNSFRSSRARLRQTTTRANAFLDNPLERWL
jgi:hypothetical protein